jgi:hypothetical protein
VRRRRRRVSKDAPARANGASSWTTLRHAMLRIAAQDEGSSIAKAAHLGVTSDPNLTIASGQAGVPASAARPLIRACRHSPYATD